MQGGNSFKYCETFALFRGIPRRGLIVVCLRSPVVSESWWHP